MLLALGVASSASAATPYDPDGLSFSTTPTADVDISSGACTFDTITGHISGGTGCPSRDNGTGNVDAGIGAVLVPSGDPNQPDTVEFVMNSLTVESGASITFIGGRNLAIGTLHDLTVASGGLVNANGLGGAGGSPGGAGHGPGGGDHSPFGSCTDSGGGGSFAGFGGDGGNGVPSGGLYGSADQSQLLGQGSGGGGAGTGSGCGTQAGGNGGGGVALIAMGALTVDGTVSADGTPTSPTSNLSNQGGPGGGSGGAVLLMAPHLVLANQSVAHAKGGYGWSTSLANGSGGGGGGGGRITMVSDQPTSALNFMATTGGVGGTTTNGGGLGLPGGEGNGGSLGGLPFLKASGPSSKPAGQTVSFAATQAFGDSTFSWDFGDGTTGTGQAASHAYTTPGIYTVTVTSTLSDSGQTATAQRSITITAAPTTGGSDGGGGGNPPPPPPPTPAVTQCIVPELKGLSLSAARKKLSRAHCSLGKVKKPKLRKSEKKTPTLVVGRQSPAAGKKLANGSKVNVTLAVKKPKRHKHG